ncbi:MAG TPA: phosphoribosylanthranilate isomerase [Bacteroidales bacterium]|nr:phosphoribosylanthranilate isomerase [Bacteroidales bacterium]
MIKVKVCGLKDPENVKKICETGIDFAGFIFSTKSPRYVGKNPDRNIFGSIPDTIGRVGVFVDEEHDKIIETAKSLGIGIIQLHGNEDLSYCGKIKASGLQVIKVFRVGNKIDLNHVNAYSDVCDYFLFDTGGRLYGGSGKKFNWDILNGLSLQKPFFLSGGIGPGDVQELGKIKNDMFFGVDINSRFEISPGIKDFEKVEVFIKKIKYEIQC